MPPTTGCLCTGGCGRRHTGQGPVRRAQPWRGCGPGCWYCEATLGSDTEGKGSSSGLTISPSTARVWFIFSN